MDYYVSLAKQAVEEYVKKGKKTAVPRDLPAEFYQKRGGVFVTIKKGGQLRGCIGTIAPTKENVAEEVIDNAIAAAIRDNRFWPVEERELPFLSYEVSILHPPFPVKRKEELDPQKLGVIVESGDGRRGLLLPDIEGIDTPEKQVYIAGQKGGIDVDSEDYTLWAFKVEKHG